MMTITKTVTLTGSSQFGENKVAATMYANLQNGNISTNITDKDLCYTGKKGYCRFHRSSIRRNGGSII